MTFNFLNFEGFIFDFDGVLTDNKVYLNEHGIETIVCSRSDGLGFDYLNETDKKVWILSSEPNSVVLTRAKKLKVNALNAISNKSDLLESLKLKENLNFDKLVYVGNDLNDYKAMLKCGLKICPNDAHPKIKEISDIVLYTNGGNGVVREILENVFNLNLIK